MEDLWSQVLAEVQVEISKPIFLGFFKPTALVSVESGVATIDAKTHIIADQLEKKYYSLIKRVIDKKTEQNLSIVFTSSGLIGKRAESENGPLFAEALTVEKKRPARIRTDYTFETLAVSDSNQLAYTAALTVAEDPGKKYNPLFLYGTVGVGKTHLMNAIANKALDANDDYKILYLTTEEFTNEVVEAIRGKNTADLRRKFRNVDLLLLDDIQFLAGKDKVQEELFHTFNTLVDRGSQIVLSSDKPPSELSKIEARLASRFEGGLSVDIEPPDFELRTAILLIKSEKYGMTFTIDAAKAAAEKIEDARALEGFLLRLASTQHEGSEINSETVGPILNKTRQTKTVSRPDSIIEAICEYYNIKPTQLKGSKRDARIVGPRHLCMFLLKEESTLTFVEIGNLLGGRDHSTVMHGVEKVRKNVEKEEKIRAEILSIKRKVKEDFARG